MSVPFRLFFLRGITWFLRMDCHIGRDIVLPTVSLAIFLRLRRGDVLDFLMNHKSNKSVSFDRGRYEPGVSTAHFTVYPMLAFFVGNIAIPRGKSHRDGMRGIGRNRLPNLLGRTLKFICTRHKYTSASREQK